MKTKFIFSLICLFFSANLIIKGQSPKRDIYTALEFSLGIPVQFARSAPLSLGDGKKGFVMLFSEERNLDPYEGSFFFPKNTPKLAVFDLEGRELWRRELAGALPGIWFIPVLPFDMDKDGVDEIYYVNNINTDRPFAYEGYMLERADVLSGEVTGRWPWKAPTHNQANSYKWRFFLIGGYVNDEPVLVTTQGTYRDMKLQAWNADMSSRWEIYYPDDFNGPRGSHTTPIIDIDHDGKEEFMYGERCISFDTGKELFVLDGNTWNDHSDVVLPIYQKKKREWSFFTCREKGDDGRLPRAVMFNQRGEQVWAIKEMKGHFHYGWVGNLGSNGERIAMAGRYNRVSGGDPERWVYDADSGIEITVPFPLGDKSDRSSLLDMDGDGIHELLIGQTLYNNAGDILFDFGESMSVLSQYKILDLLGEQLMCYYPNGIVKIWADRNGSETTEMKKRFSDPIYVNNVRHSSTGYNRNYPILNY